MTRYKVVLTVVLEGSSKKAVDEHFWDLACDGALNDFYTITKTDEPVSETH